MEKYIKVPKGATVNWRVYCDGYEEQVGTETINNNLTLNVDLVSSVVLTTLSINPTPSDAIVTMSVDGQTIDTTTIQKTTLYAWNSNSEIVYTASETPVIGDTIYNQDGTTTSQKVTAIDDTAIEIG